MSADIMGTLPAHPRTALRQAVGALIEAAGFSGRVYLNPEEPWDAPAFPSVGVYVMSEQAAESGHSPLRPWTGSSPPAAEGWKTLNIPAWNSARLTTGKSPLPASRSRLRPFTGCRRVMGQWTCSGPDTSNGILPTG